jgi:hypothetical protein
MVFLEQFLEVALLVKIGHEHDFDFSETRRSAVGERWSGRFFAFHAPQDKKLAEVCSAKSALTLFYWLPATFMHTRWGKTVLTEDLRIHSVP